MITKRYTVYTGYRPASIVYQIISTIVKLIPVAQEKVDSKIAVSVLTGMDRHKKISVRVAKVFGLDLLEVVQTSVVAWSHRRVRCVLEGVHRCSVGIERTLAMG